MKNGTVVVFLAALTIGVSGACSSKSEPPPAPGTLSAGTAQLVLGSKSLGTTEAMRCLTIDMSTLITIGEEDAGVTLFLSSARRLTPEWVRIRNVNGFSGDYARGLEGNAAASATATTYDISGAARGYGVESYLPITKQFAIKVSC